MPFARTALLVGLTFAVTACAESKDRVAEARKEKGERVRALFEGKGVQYPPQSLYLRAFKSEGDLELWAGPSDGPLTLVKTYSICMRSGDLGPKRELGDGQVPEGFYVIDRFNPRSNFHLSLGVSYPNDSDRIRGVKGRLGGDIFIHGSCVTVGCIPLRDGPIEEVYLAALDARTQGLRSIPVHIFPARLTDEAMKELKEDAEPAVWSFWQELKPGFDAFEQTKRVPKVSVDPKTGAYLVAQRRTANARPAAK